MNNLLSDDHAAVDVIVRELEKAFETGDAELVFERLDLFWARLAMHIRAEHLHLFPTLRRALEKNAAEANALARRIEELKSDHDFFMRELAAAVKTMRELSGRNAAESERTAALAAVRRQVAAVAARLAAHNELEEREVYRLIDELTDESERFRLNAALKREIENLPPRFRPASGVKD